jgi:5'-nucleotidase / UDP-sugar diphosphatase
MKFLLIIIKTLIHNNMKKIVLNLFLLSIPIIFSAQSSRLVILHTNDIHSKLTGYAPEIEYSPLKTNNDKTLGGFARIASIINAEKQLNGDNLLVVDAGDFLMGSFFHMLEPVNGLQLQLMKQAGYDVVAIGNHEFDNKPAILAQIINKSRANGDIPQLCISNIEFSEKDTSDDDLEELFKQGVISPYTIVERAGLKIGVFALMGYDARDVALYTDPLKILDPIKTAKKTSKMLKKDEGVDFVICLSHSGVVPTKEGGWEGEDVILARKAKYIDVIISGHTHSKISEVIWENETPIVQTGAYGQYVGKLELDISDGKISFAKYKLIQVNDEILGDEDIHNQIEKQKELLNEAFLDDLKIVYDEPVVETSYDLTCNEHDPENSTLGPMLADAIYYYINENTEEGTDISLIATGLIRDNIKKGDTGLQTASDLFRIVSLGLGDDPIPGYPLARVYLSPIEIKRVIEILLVISPSNTAAYCYYSGMEVEIDTSKGFLKKVQRILINGKELDLSKKNETLYSLSASIYMLESIGIIKKMTYGIIKVEPKDFEGNILKDFKNTWIDFDLSKEGVQEGKEWLALLEFVKTFEDNNGNNIPDIPEFYNTPKLVFKHINK